MAKKTKKEKNIDILDYKIAKEEALLEEWEAHGISQRKIEKMKAKKDKHKDDKVKWEAS